MDRPRCRRCGGPLDLTYDLDEGGAVWDCNNPTGRHAPALTDDEFARLWGALTAEEQYRLLRRLYND